MTVLFVIPNLVYTSFFLFLHRLPIEAVSGRAVSGRAVSGRAAALSGLTMKRLLVIVYPTYVVDLLQGAALVAVRTPCM